MSKPTMLFLRQYTYFLGGHLKVFDYLDHVARSGRFDPLLYLTPDSIDASAFIPTGTTVVREPIPADAYFVAGANWRFLDAAGVDTSTGLVINLIQGFQHLGEGPHSAYLSRKAIRVCVSEPVAGALLDSRRANGPIITIPLGVNVESLEPFMYNPKSTRVFVAGVKNGALARELSAEFEARGCATDACVERVAREEFLARMSRCAVTIALPHDAEGFFLPAIEAMALGSALVIPHARGPASFCRDGVNCIVTDGTVSSTVAAGISLLADHTRRNAVCARAQETVATYSIERERAAFYDVLDRFAPNS